MRSDRRNFLRAALGGVGAAAVPRTSRAVSAAGQIPSDAVAGAGVPFVTPDLPTLSSTVEDGAKVFHLVAEPVRTDFMPGRPVDCWGFNGSMPGPTIEVTEGDRVRLVVENRLPELFSIHWHGFEVPFEMDGVPGLTQDPIAPGETFVYEFTLHQHGTFFYHSHMAMQEMMGMIGLFIMHPRTPYTPRVDRDFGRIF
jgi:FtsP/CotA-like multicopper oxidase with cupredoxin domain